MRPALVLFTLVLSQFAVLRSEAAQLVAGVAKVDITDRAAGPVNDPSYAKALVLRDGATTVVLVTVDAVAIGGIGRIGNDYLGNVRAALERELGIPPASVLVNASHCHSVVRADTDANTGQFWLRDEQVRANGLAPIAHHLVLGHYQRWGPVVTFSRNPGRYGGGMLAGEHTDAILATLGYSEHEIQMLKSEQVVLRSDRMLNIEHPE